MSRSPTRLCISVYILRSSFAIEFFGPEPKGAIGNGRCPRGRKDSIAGGELQKKCDKKWNEDRDRSKDVEFALPQPCERTLANDRYNPPPPDASLLLARCKYRIDSLRHTSTSISTFYYLRAPFSSATEKGRPGTHAHTHQRQLTLQILRCI